MKYYQTPEFRAEQKEWYKKLKDAGFDDIEGGLEYARYNSAKGGAHSRLGLNAALDKPVVTRPGRWRGREWEQLLSPSHRGVEPRHAPVGRYIHFAQLVCAQEYALCRLGVYKAAAEERAMWSLHAQGVSERDIGKLLELPRYRVRAAISRLQGILYAALDAEADGVLD